MSKHKQLSKKKGPQKSKSKPYIQKTVLSDETLPHFQWELRPHRSMADEFFKKHPMSGARNADVESARRAAVDVLLANMHNGTKLNVPNFGKIRAEELGFGRKVFLDVLNYLQAPTLIGREGDGEKRSTITYSIDMWPFRPTKVVFQPLSPVRINLKDKGISMRPKDNEVRNNLNQRMRKIWAFYKEHEILSGIDDETFKLFNDVEVEVEKKPPLIRPDTAKILPECVFNDRDLTKGGRMYGAFWIGMKSELRRLITIDGELTSDIDGKGMHVQLMYRAKGLHMPDGDPYIFSDPVQRKIAKNLMLLMMNTRNRFEPTEGRKNVQRTYRRNFGKDDGLEEMILKLEIQHHAILDDLYRPNWSHLQRTEAAIMLSIMERGMDDGIVVLPVHDGCLCPRQHVGKVQGYFDQEGVEAAVNWKHYQPLPVEKAREALAAVRKYRQAA